MKVSASKYRPILYLEGVQFPVRKLEATFSAQGQSLINAVIPGNPLLWPKLNITDADGSETDPDGHKIYAKYEMQGIQPKTIAHVFVVDESTGEEVFLTEGRLAGSPSFSMAKDGTVIHLTFIGSPSYMMEIAMYMADQAKTLGISSSSDWGSRDGAATTSSIVSTLKSEGLSDGILKLLKDSGQKKNAYLNLVWRLLRLEQRIQIINNPKALGYFNESNMAKILDKTIGRTSSTQPISHVIMSILRLLRYITYNVPAPSFLNAKYQGPTASSEVIAEGDEDSPEGEDEVIINSINDCSISNGDELKMNDWIMAPEMPMAPPPRCNVIFPIEYQRVSYAPSFDQRPTRGIGRLSGRATLSETSKDALVFPEELRGKLEEYTHFTSAEEKYRGIILSQFNMDRPEYFNDLDSDYVRGYLEQSFEASKWNGQCQISQGAAGSTLNLRPVAGFSALVLLRNGQHIIAHLEAVKHSFDLEQGAWTSYVLSNARPYDAEVPVSGSALWNRHEFFDQKNIGIRIYPMILGRFFDTIDQLNSEENDDLSILKHLFRAGMSESDVEEAKSASDAVAKAVDALWDEYKEHKYPDIYAYNYGRRIPITREHLFNDFYNAQMSTDKMMIIGGYRLETNQVTVSGGEESIEPGQNISEDTKLSGCFVKERQECYTIPAATLFFGDGVARDSSEALDILTEYVADSKAGTLTAQEEHELSSQMADIRRSLFEEII